jgi:hypothetical protein
MPRGSKPGERRGGRRPGSKNRRTLALEAAVQAMADGARADELPAEFLRKVCQNEKLDLNVRIAAAQAAAPYYSSKLASVRVEHEHKPRAIYYLADEPELTVDQWVERYCIEPGTPFISDRPFADDPGVAQSQDAIHRLQVDALRRENEELKAEIAKLRTEAALRNDPAVAMKTIPVLS